MQNLLAVRPIDGWRIYDPLGVWVGNVDTLLLDGTTGFARLVWTSFFSPSIDRIALPWIALSFDRRRSAFTTLVTDDLLKSAPRVGMTQEADEVERRLVEHYTTSDAGRPSSKS
jgi:hypothetical protein